MAQLSLALIGFGNVGRAFVRLLMQKKALLKEQFNLDFRITGIATGRHGMAINPAGLDPREAVYLIDNNRSLENLSSVPNPQDVFEFIRNSGADIIFENTPVNHSTGRPASDYLRAALERGMHAITANKGPIVYAYDELTNLAAKKGCRFLFESSVMDGAPIFSLFRGSLPATNLLGFYGILNSCTNFILCQMEQGIPFQTAVKKAQSIGIAETNPDADIDGWDAAIKVAALTTVLMSVPLQPDQIKVEGIRGITPQMIEAARNAGERWKLVCSAHREENRIIAHVAPERVSPASPLFNVDGTSSYIQFNLDVLPGLGIFEKDPGPETTAYGLMADLINAFRENHNDDDFSGG